MRERLVAGRILKARGLEGEVKVLPYAEETNRFCRLKSCWAERENGEFVRELKVVKASVSGGQVFLRFAGIEDRHAADALQGLYLSVPRSEAVSLDQDSWFVCDLLNCEVIDERYGNLGVVSDVTESPSDDLLIVRQAGVKDLLIPLRKAFLRQVSPTEGKIYVALPDGLYEVYRG